MEGSPIQRHRRTHYPLRLLDEEEEEEDVFLLSAMDATALAHATSSRFIRFSSLQIIGSTIRSLSVARNTVGADALPEASSSPLAACGIGRRSASAPRAIDRDDTVPAPTSSTPPT
jgi:hypothetical protein